ncbi:MAG TPA: GNAT family N-acetyltransferase [Clostridia bacterium]|nr:GNAT family N-acetyltransferase [Clostridia bacterium]
MDFMIERFVLESGIMEEVLRLYESAGWANYVKKPEMLQNALKNSFAALCARVDGHLVGLIRAVGDGHSVLYVQDLLVLPEFRRMGIGSALLHALDARYPNVYQKVLLTDGKIENGRFYESCGFMSASRIGCAAYVKMRI